MDEKGFINASENCNFCITLSFVKRIQTKIIKVHHKKKVSQICSCDVSKLVVGLFPRVQVESDICSISKHNLFSRAYNNIVWQFLRKKRRCTFVLLSGTLCLAYHKIDRDQYYFSLAVIGLSVATLFTSATQWFLPQYQRLCVRERSVCDREREIVCVKGRMRMVVAL